MDSVALAPRAADLDEEQRSENWSESRAGCVTGTGFECVLAKLKNGAEAKTRRDYRWQLITERLTGIPNEKRFHNPAMDRGIMMEPEARSAYEDHAGVFVEQVGFRYHPEIEWVGVSSDGLISPNGCTEIKCPDNAAIHLQSLISGSDAMAAALMAEEEQDIEAALKASLNYISAQIPKRRPGVGTGTKQLKMVPIPSQYYPQVQGNLWVLGREWCDYVSYDPRFPPHLRLYVHRVYRDEPYISKLKDEVLQFLEEVESAVARLLLPNQ